MNKPRALPRFAVGQRVRIKDTIATRYVGREGMVIAVNPNHHAKPTNTSLDRYTVAFSADEEAKFFDVQLESVSDGVGQTTIPSSPPPVGTITRRWLPGAWSRTQNGSLQGR
jgi:predicted P-loop ATPase/GTPase